MSHHSYGSLDDPSGTVSVGRLCLHPEVCFQSLGASRSDERVEKTGNVQKMEVPGRRRGRLLLFPGAQLSGW